LASSGVHTSEWPILDRFRLIALLFIASSGVVWSVEIGFGVQRVGWFRSEQQPSRKGGGFFVFEYERFREISGHSTHHPHSPRGRTTTQWDETKTTALTRISIATR
jgi:hypothetical protein